MLSYTTHAPNFARQVLREVGANRDEITGRIDKGAFKVVYVAPMKALAAEVGAFLERGKGEGGKGLRAFKAVYVAPMCPAVVFLQGRGCRLHPTPAHPIPTAPPHPAAPR